MLWSARLLTAAALAMSVSSCQVAGSSGLGPDGYPKLRPQFFASSIHPDIRPEFLSDHGRVIVNATSATALERACPGVVRIRAPYRASVTSALRTNDLIMGYGASQREIAAKIASSRTQCDSVSSGVNFGFSDNVFLETRRVLQ